MGHIQWEIYPLNSWTENLASKYPILVKSFSVSYWSYIPWNFTGISQIYSNWYQSTVVIDFSDLSYCSLPSKYFIKLNFK